MTWSLVLGGAKCVYDDIAAATEQFGQPDIVVAVKDIWVTYPRVDYVVSYHADRLPAELEERDRLGLQRPIAAYVYHGTPIPRMPLRVECVHSPGGSSGLMGAMLGCRIADKAVLCGIPMDPQMPHFNMRKEGRPWVSATVFQPVWLGERGSLFGRVRSMSGWTKELLSLPDKEWLETPLEGPRPAWPEVPDPSIKPLNRRNLTMELHRALNR